MPTGIASRTSLKTENLRLQLGASIIYILAGPRVVLIIVSVRYLLQLTKVDDFTSWDHHQFRICQAPLPEGVEDPVAAWKLPEDDGS